LGQTVNAPYLQKMMFTQADYFSSVARIVEGSSQNSS